MEKMISLTDLEHLLNAEWNRHMNVVKNTKNSKTMRHVYHGGALAIGVLANKLGIELAYKKRFDESEGNV